MMAAISATALPAQGPLIYLVVADPLRLRQLERDLQRFPRAGREADVMVVHVPQGARVPAEASGFDGAVLVLSDDPVISADLALQGVLPASAASGQIAAAIAALAEGLTVRLPGLAGLPGFAPPDVAQRPLLTPRELEVLALVGEGMSNKTIARKLGISAHTVKYHLEAVFTKLGVRSRAEAVTRGLRRGLLVV
jgi:DNA-binding CsgD family transcriptional regulator